MSNCSLTVAGLLRRLRESQTAKKWSPLLLFSTSLSERIDAACCEKPQDDGRSEVHVIKSVLCAFHMLFYLILTSHCIKAATALLAELFSCRGLWRFLLDHFFKIAFSKACEHSSHGRAGEKNKTIPPKKHTHTYPINGQIHAHAHVQIWSPGLVQLRVTRRLHMSHLSIHRAIKRT